MDVSGRPWMAPRAGFEVGRKFLSANVDNAPVSSEYPQRYPRDNDPGFLAWLLSRVHAFASRGRQTELITVAGRRARFRELVNGAPGPVRLALRTDDGALLLLEYHGIVQASAAFTRAVESDSSTKWNDQYMRMALTFDTEAERYAWPMQSLFIARGRLLGTNAIEYDVYRVQ